MLILKTKEKAGFESSATGKNKLISIEVTIETDAPAADGINNLLVITSAISAPNSVMSP